MSDKIKKEETNAANLGGSVSCIKTLGQIAFCALVLLGANSAPCQPPTPGHSPGSSLDPTFDLTSKPAPALPGPFCACSASIDKPGPFADTYYGIFYFPRPRTEDDRRECVPDHRECSKIRGGPYNLAVVHYAIGSGGAGAYEGLATHLATHGFAVASMATNSDATFASKGLDYLYQEVGGSLTNEVALIGHSAGGDLVLSEGQYVSAPPLNKHLAAMVLMAPRIYSNESFDLNGVTSAFLGLHWTSDNDDATYGALGPPRRSVFKAYDNAGIVSNDANSLSLTKDFVFFEFPTHYLQNNPGIVAYTTAFLHRHLAGRKIYDRFLKHQEVPVGLSPADRPISQQHADPDRLAVANFESGDLSPALFTNAFEAGIGVVVHFFDWSWNLDFYSPHDTRAFKISVFDASAGTGVEFPFSEPAPLTGYNYLSLRVTQVYHDADAPTGGDRSFVVELCDLDTCWGLDLAEYGGIPFPVVVNPLNITGGGSDNATKNAMRSILLPIKDFGLPIDTAVERIRFNFSDGNADNAAFIVDDIEFYQ